MSEAKIIVGTPKTPTAFTKYMRFYAGWCNGAGCQPMHPDYSTDPIMELRTIYEQGYKAGQQIRRREMDAKAQEMGIVLGVIKPQTPTTKD